MNQLAILAAGLVARTAARRWAQNKGYQAEMTLVIAWAAGVTVSAATAALLNRS